MRVRVLAGLAAGFAISSRYFMVALLPILPLAELAAAKDHPPGSRALRWLGWSALLGLAALAGFALTSPYVFIRYDIALHNLAGESRTTHLGADGLTPAGNLLWYVTTLLPRNVSWMFILLAAVGLLLVLQQRRTPGLLLAANTGLFIVAICLPHLHWDRWIIPALPLFSLLAAHALAVILRRCAAHRPAPLRCEPLLLALLTVIVSARAARCAVEDSIQASQPGTRIAALNWLRENARPGARIFQEGQTLPEQGELYSARGCYALGRDWPDQPAQHRDCDFIVANSRMYERYFAEPERYADELAVYHWLFTRCRLAAEFTPSPAQAGPTVRIYALPRPAPENTAP